MEGRVIAIAGLKGGLGKSTIAANLAAELQALQRTVRVLDTDPQRTLVAWAALGSGVLAKLVEPFVAISADRFVAHVRELRTSTERIVIDTPPGFPEPTLMAVSVADLVLLPVTPSPLDLFAVREMLMLVDDARAKRGDGMPLVRLVPSRVSATGLGRQLAGSLDALSNEKRLTAIGQRVPTVASAVDGRVVRELAPSSVAAREFAKLARGVESLLG